MANTLKHKTLSNKPAAGSVIGGPEWDQEHLFAGGVSEGDLLCWSPTATDKVRLGYNAVDVINGQSNYIGNKIVPTLIGSNQQIGVYISMTGGAVLAAGKYRIPLGLFVQTGGAAGSADGIEGFNVTVQQNAADAATANIGIEVDLNNNKADRAQDDANASVGFSAVSSGSNINDKAFSVGGTGLWRQAFEVEQSALASGGFVFRYKGKAAGVGASSLDDSGNLSLGGSLTIGGGSFAASRIYRDATNGLSLAGFAGSTHEFLMFNAAGTLQLLSYDSTQIFTFGPTGSSIGLLINSDRNLRFANQTSSAGASTATLTNAPASGNPTFWLRLIVNGSNVAIPCWAG